MRVTTLLVAVLSAACATRSRPAATALPGAYRFVALDARRLPVEFPASSGALLESGTLELRPDGRFSLRFVGRQSAADTSRASGEDGQYRVGGDTLYFTPDGREARPPVWFRFAFTEGGLRLVDRSGNSWAYARATR